MKKTLMEYVGDMSRSLPAMVTSLEQIFGKMYQVGGKNRIYEISDGKSGTIYTFGKGGSAIGLGWKNNKMVDTIYWWDRFDFGMSDYELSLPEGIDVEKILPQIKNSIQQKQLGEISL